MDANKPDIYIKSFHDITPEVLKKYNIKGVLTDLDDTLVVHGGQTIEPDLLAWIHMLKNENIRICIVSNNSNNRIRPFAKALDVAYIGHAFKPMRYWVQKAMDLLMLKKEETVFIGDQLFTDVRGAKKMGILSVLVDPVGNKSFWFVAMKRIKEQKIRDTLTKTEL